MKEFVYSKNVLIKAKKPDGNYYPFLCVEEVGLQKRKGTIEIVSVAAGGWDEFEFDRRRGWDVTLRGVCLLNDVSGGWTLSEVWALMDSFDKLDIQMIFTDTANNTLVKSGQVLPSELGITASMGDGGEAAKWNTTMKGTGELI